MDPLLITGRRSSRTRSLPELTDPRRRRLVAGRWVDRPEPARPRGVSAAAAAGGGAAHWLNGEAEESWVRRAVRNQLHELKAALRAADRSRRHRRNPRSALSVIQREGGLLPAEDVRQTLAKRGIPLTDSYWQTLCQQCCARSATVAAARPGADMVYARLLNRFIQESDPQKQEGALTSVSDKWCSLPQAQEMIRRKITEKTTSGPAELRRAFQFMDVDGSGCISKTELRDALRVRANLELEDRLLEKVLRSYDVDNSGTINYQEFCERIMQSHTDDSVSGVAVKPLGAKRDAPSMFHRKMRLAFREMRFQAKRLHPSGKLNMEELVRLLESFDISAEKAELSKLAAQCKARDPDGQIDWPLFLAGVQGVQNAFAKQPTKISSRWHSVSQARQLVREKISACVVSGQSELRNAFTLMDVDGSGHISRAEFDSALRERANLALDEMLLEAVWKSYGVHVEGEIDFGVFCRVVMAAEGYDTVAPRPRASSPGDAGTVMQSSLPPIRHRSKPRKPTYQISRPF